MNHRPSLTIAALLLLALQTAHADSKESLILKVWPDGAPGEPLLKAEQIKKLKARNTASRVYYVEDPTLHVYKAPAKKANGCGVVICPGGGYHILAWDHEGEDVARWLNSIGVTAAILKYRVPRRSGTEPHKAPLQDAQRAVRLMRKHAKDWGVDPQRVGVLGFSAGGNLTMMTGLSHREQTYKKVDEADDLSARPDFLIPIYAAYLGKKDAPYTLSPLLKIDKSTPPVFSAVTYDDKHRAVHAALLFAKLHEVGVPAEVHLFTKGGHGYGLRETGKPVAQWPKLCADWLKDMGLLGQ